MRVSPGLRGPRKNVYEKGTTIDAGVAPLFTLAAARHRYPTDLPPSRGFNSTGPPPKYVSLRLETVILVSACERCDLEWNLPRYKHGVESTSVYINDDDDVTAKGWLRRGACTTFLLVAFIVEFLVILPAKDSFIKPSYVRETMARVYHGEHEHSSDTSFDVESYSNLWTCIYKISVKNRGSFCLLVSRINVAIPSNRFILFFNVCCYERTCSIFVSLFYLPPRIYNFIKFKNIEELLPASVEGQCCNSF